jgi:FlaA1/EpsC-like NDP-sugar epimerase
VTGTVASTDSAVRADPHRHFFWRSASMARLITRGHPRRLIGLLALLVFASAYTLAFLLRFDFDLPERYLDFVLITLPVALIIKLIVFYAMGIFRIVWAYIGLRDGLRILRATAFASAALTATNVLLLPSTLIPRSILIVDAVLTFLGIAGAFGLLRLGREASYPVPRVALAQEPVFIVGAGDAGDLLLRELTRKADSTVRVVGFLDDDPAKQGQVHRGLPVLGALADAGALARHHGVFRGLVAMPNIDGSVMRRVLQQLSEAGLALKMLPPVERLLNSTTLATQLREVSIEDLLRRPSPRLDNAAIRSFLGGRRVLVTGAAGSIGSEICRQVLAFGPSLVVGLDCAESPLHELAVEFPSFRNLVPELVDVTDATALRRVFQAHRPEVVFHAAAVKHVPLLEAHPARALQVNVGGTRLVAEAARDYARAFVMISTDKAVNPTSVMGASKRVAERIIRGLVAPGGPRYVSVRFGNVLGSAGSVVPTFKRQIALGGPVTVTHAEMRRYFMTIPEAVQLVLQASALGEGGDIFVLDMGEPVRIVDLAEDLIRLSGLKPHEDIKIEFTGIRPGEKLFEEWSMHSESLVPTTHPQVFRLRSPEGAVPEQDMRRLQALGVARASRDDIVACLSEIVSDFRPASTEGTLTAVQGNAAGRSGRP